MIHDHKFFGATEAVPTVTGVSEVAFFSNVHEEARCFGDWSRDFSSKLVRRPSDDIHVRISSANDGRFVVILRQSVASSSGTISGKQDKYKKLYQALATLKDLDEEDAMAIDEQTYMSARNALSYMSYKSVEPPRIFAHGGDAVVFNWTKGATSFQLTVSGGIAALGKRVKGEGVANLGYVDMSERGIGGLISYLQVDSGWAGTNISSID